MSLFSKQMGWDAQDKKKWPVVPEIEGGGILNVPGGLLNSIYNSYHDLVNPGRHGTSTSQSSNLLKTQTAGTGSNFGRYGDISQQAPGGWIRQQNQNRDGRSSTLMTRGLSKKQINARNTA